MNRSIAAFLLIVGITFSCQATIIDERDLAEIYETSGVVMYGSVKSATIARCGGNHEVSGLYVLHVTAVVKGRIKSGDVKVCAQASMSLSDNYIVAGDLYGKNEVVVAPDAIVLWATRGRFYRLISDSPFRRTSDGEVYAVGKRVPDFMSRFHDSFRDVDF